MSGGYITCGNFQGSPETGTAFFEMIDDIIPLLTEEEKLFWKRDFIPLLREQLEEQGDDDQPVLQLSPDMMDVLVPPMERYCEQLLKRLGNPPREMWGQLGEPGTGEGWRLMCGNDLLLAYDACCQSGDDVMIFFE